MGIADPSGPIEPLGPGAVDADALQFIAEGVTELAGFDLAAISIVHDGRLHTVALAGADHARAQLSTRQPAVADVLAGLELAEDWGPLRFVPYERETTGLADYSFIPDVAPLDAPDAWQPRDLLLALLEDDRGSSVASCRWTCHATACAPTSSSDASWRSTHGRPVGRWSPSWSGTSSSERCAASGLRPTIAAT